MQSKHQIIHWFLTTLNDSQMIKNKFDLIYGGIDSLSICCVQKKLRIVHGKLNRQLR